MRLLLPLLLLVPLVACSDDSDDTTPDVAVEAPTPRDHLERAVSTWNANESFHFTLQVANRSIALDSTGLLAYQMAEGDVVVPDRLQAQATVQTPVGNTPVALIVIGDRTWVTNPLTRQWAEAPGGTAGEVAALFHPETGIGAMLLEMEDIDVAGETTVQGTAGRTITGALPRDLLARIDANLAELLAQNADLGQLQVELFVGRDDDQIRQIVLREPADSTGAVPTWTFMFSNFGQSVEIQPPL